MSISEARELLRKKGFHVSRAAIAEDLAPFTGSSEQLAVHVDHDNAAWLPVGRRMPFTIAIGRGILFVGTFAPNLFMILGPEDLASLCAAVLVRKTNDIVSALRERAVGVSVREVIPADLRRAAPDAPRASYDPAERGEPHRNASLLFSQLKSRGSPISGVSSADILLVHSGNLELVIAPPLSDHVPALLLLPSSPGSPWTPSSTLMELANAAIYIDSKLVRDEDFDL